MPKVHTAKRSPWFYHIGGCQSHAKRFCSFQNSHHFLFERVVGTGRISERRAYATNPSAGSRHKYPVQVFTASLSHTVQKRFQEQRPVYIAFFIKHAYLFFNEFRRCGNYTSSRGTGFLTVFCLHYTIAQTQLGLIVFASQQISFQRHIKDHIPQRIIRIKKNMIFRS